MEPEELRRQLKKWAIIGSFFALAFLLYALDMRKTLVAYAMVVALLSMGAILIQSGRGGGLAASLGGGGGDSLFGARSATPIARATYVMLALFVVICMLIARLPMVQRGGLVVPPLGPAGPAQAAGQTAPPAEEPTPAESASGAAGSGLDQPEQGGAND